MNPVWLHALRASASRPPLRPRQPVWAGASLIGSVEADFLSQISFLPNEYLRGQLLKEERAGVPGWAVQGDLTTTLNHLAAAMRDAGLAGAWRDEQLAVLDETGRRLGTMERAAVRPLGITTHAVHLVGQTPDGRCWVQQRAFNKSVDPGLWDTLMGGMVAAADTLETALQRETWEEAGLQLTDLQDLRYGGRLTTRRPSDDGAGAGYVVEHIDWYRCTVPDGLAPRNQDGEVECFALLTPDELLRRMQNNEFTIDAAVIFAKLLCL